MRIITCNVNGLRAADRKGFTAWMLEQKPDVACLQEIKAQESDLTKDRLAPKGLHGFFHPAQKRGYSGVAIYARKQPDNVTPGLGTADIDARGRFLPNPDRFTWWVQWANARERNIGWRIDYQIATPGIAAKAAKAAIYTQAVFSDHAPVVVDYDYTP